LLKKKAKFSPVVQALLVPGKERELLKNSPCGLSERVKYRSIVIKEAG